MRLAHLSDLHLGFRAFPRVERGWNLRERDVATAFQHAVQEIGRLRPDAVLISGNLFDHPDPPSTAFLTLSRGIRTLHEVLPGIPVLAIAGERDTPPTPADPGPVSVLDALPGVEAAAGAPRAVRLRRIGAHVLLVPHRSVVRPPFPDLRPDPDARWNLLVLRGQPAVRPTEDAVLHLEPGGWDYIALGGAHGVRRWGGGRIRCSGALERIGGDPWREAADERGFLLVDLATGEEDFHAVPGRPVVDLAPIRVDPTDPAIGSRRLREVLDGVPGGIEGKLLRIRLQGQADAPGQVVAAGLLEAIRRRAAHVEFRIGEVSDSPAPTSPDAARSLAARPPVLHWRTGSSRGGRVRLIPGLWGFTALGSKDRGLLEEALNRALSEPSGGDDPPWRTEEGPVGATSRLRLALELPAGAPASAGPTPLAGDARSPGDLLDRASTLLGEPGAPGDSPSPVPADHPEGGNERERELRRLRGDWVEAAGDLEARTLEWGRERQEAESRLAAYRDRAWELRERIRLLEARGDEAECPTCGRNLEDARSGLLEALREEWEEVVQDGKWWRRRREQLDDKPAGLRALERRALELHAEVESMSERLEGARTAALRDGADEPAPARLARPGPAVRALLRRAGSLLHRLSEGAIDGLTIGPAGEIRFLEGGSTSRSAAPEDAPVLMAALRLALALELVARGGVPAPVVLLGGLSGADPEGFGARLAEMVSREGGGAEAVLMVLPPGVLARVPEAFQGSVELVRDSDGRPRVRVAPPGRARVALAEPAS